MAHDNKVRKPFLSIEIHHYGFVLSYHIAFNFELQKFTLIHAILVGLTNNSDDEVHENDVAHRHYNQPDKPDEDGVIAIKSTLNKIIIFFIVTYRLPQS